MTKRIDDKAQAEADAAYFKAKEEARAANAVRDKAMAKARAANAAYYKAKAEARAANAVHDKALAKEGA